MTATIPETAQSTADRVWTQHRNGAEVELLLNYTNLPAPVIVPRVDAVHVMVADIDDLGVWLEQRGGTIHRSPAFEGVRMWTLHTKTDPRPDGTTIPILVSVPVVDGDLVMHWIAAAVAA